MAKLSKPLRISLDLFQQADRESKPLRRSTPKQIEYWAMLGQKVERFLSTNDIIAIEQGLATISIKSEHIEPINTDSVFANLRDDVESGAFTSSVRGSAEFVYEASSSAEGKIDKVLTNGERITGRFVNGDFQPIGQSLTV